MDVDSGSESDSEDSIPKPYNYNAYLQNNPIQIKTPLQAPIPKHKYHTRLLTKHQSDSARTAAINAQLQPVYDTDSDATQKRESNDKIIKDKPTYPTYNKELLNSRVAPISDKYNITNISNQCIKDKQYSDALLFPDN